MNIKRFFYFILGCLLLAGCMLTFSGCARYHAGYPIDATSIRSIYVAPAIKKALSAQTSAILTRQLREGILRNGGIGLADKHDADATLETTITHYGRSIGTVEEYDTNTAKTLSLNITVQCSLKDNRTDAYYFKNQTFSASISINANNAAQSIEYQRLPQLTHKLAQQVVMCIANIHPLPSYVNEAGKVSPIDSQNFSTKKNSSEILP